MQKKNCFSNFTLAVALMSLIMHTPFGPDWRRLRSASSSHKVHKRKTIFLIASPKSIIQKSKMLNNYKWFLWSVQYSEKKN